MKHWRRASPVEYRRMAATDVTRMVLQPSQIGQLGIYEPVRDEKHGAELVEAGPAWAAETADGEIWCLAGFAEVFPQRQAIAWALLSANMSIAAHIGLTGFMADRLAEQPYRRIEAVARAASRKELNWLRRLGFVPEGVMHDWGPLSEDHVVFRYVRSGG